MWKNILLTLFFKTHGSWILHQKTTFQVLPKKLHLILVISWGKNAFIIYFNVLFVLHRWKVAKFNTWRSKKLWCHVIKQRVTHTKKKKKNLMQVNCPIITRAVRCCRFLKQMGATLQPVTAFFQPKAEKEGDLQ